MHKFLLFLFSFFLFLGFCFSSREGVGFAFSGAGGRIGQHAALMEALVKGNYPSGVPIRPSFISGASSGAISAVALSAILETEDKNLPDGLTWETFHSLLFSLSSGKVFDDSIWGIERIFTHNIPEGYILDNTPLQKFLSSWVKKMNYTYFGDLYIPTSISLVNQSSGATVRIWSDDPRYAKLDLVQVIMASTALPIAFQTRKIDGFGDNTIFIDGGTGIDTIPVYSLLQHPKVKEVYIICYSSAMKSGGGTLPPLLRHIAILYNSLAVIDDMRVDLFDGAVDMAMKSNVSSYTYIPDLAKMYSALDFDHEKEEFEKTMKWAQTHDPIPLN